MRGIIILLLLFLSISLHAQVDSTSTGEVVDAEIVIEKDRQIKLPVASKLSPGIKSDVRDVQPLNLVFQSVEPDFNWPSYKSEVSFEKSKESFTTVPYQNSIKFGYGNYGSPLLEIKYFNSLNLVKLGSEIFHESFHEGPIATTNSSSSDSRVRVLANYAKDGLQLIPEFEFNRNGYRFFGNTDRLNSGFNSDEASRVVRSNTNFRFILKGGSKDLSYSAIPHVYQTDQSVQDGVQINRESGFSLRSDMKIKVDKTLEVGLGLDADASSYQGGLDYNRSLFVVRPWIEYSGSNLNIKGGFGLTAGKTAEEANETGIYPFVDLKLKLNDNWSLLGSVESGLRWNALDDLFSQNQFLDDSLSIENTELVSSFGGGLRGSLTKNLLVETGVSWETVNSMPFFIPSLSDSSRYTITYDGGNTNILSFNSKGTYATSTNSSVGVKLNLFSYTTATLEKAWHLPSYSFSLFFVKNIKEKFFINSEVIAQGGIEAPGTTTIEVIDLNSFVDLNLNLDYKATDRFSVFLKLNNLFNKEYEKYIGYPVRGASFKVGGKYRF